MLEISRFTRFVIWMVKCAVTGSPAYYLWMAGLILVGGVGSFAYSHHLSEGLVVTNMNDDVSWGIGIANFVAISQKR